MAGAKRARLLQLVHLILIEVAALVLLRYQVSARAGGMPRTRPRAVTFRLEVLQAVRCLVVAVLRVLSGLLFLVNIKVQFLLSLDDAKLIWCERIVE